MNGQAGKGDTYRPVNRKLWEEAWDRLQKSKQEKSESEKKQSSQEKK